MAATVLTMNTVTHLGFDLTAAMQTPTQTTGHTAPCAPDAFLAVANGSGASINVDVHVPGTVDSLPVATPTGGAAPARRVAVAAGHTELIPIPLDTYGGVSGLATFDLSAYASVTFCAVRVGAS